MPSCNERNKKCCGFDGCQVPTEFPPFWFPTRVFPCFLTSSRPSRPSSIHILTQPPNMRMRTRRTQTCKHTLHMHQHNSARKSTPHTFVRTRSHLGMRARTHSRVHLEHGASHASEAQSADCVNFIRSRPLYESILNRVVASRAIATRVAQLVHAIAHI